MWALLPKIETRSGALYLISCFTGELMMGKEDKSEEEMQLTKPYVRVPLSRLAT